MHLVPIKPPELFQALADPTRIRVIRLLERNGDEACLCELSDSLLIPEYSLSRHLKVLRQVGLLAAVREGRWVYHRVAKGPPHLDDLVGVVCSLPDPDKVFAGDLARFKKRTALRIDGRRRGSEALPSAKLGAAEVYGITGCWIMTQ